METKLLRGQKGQSLFFVLILAAVLSLAAMGLLKIFEQGNKLAVINDCMMKKEELSIIALEHALYRLQQGSAWEDFSSLPGMTGHSKQFSTKLGTYSLSVEKGNLFLTNPSDPDSRQDKTDYRTIFIRVLTEPVKCDGEYYAVVKNAGYGGPLISRGKIDLPCSESKSFTKTLLTKKLFFHYGFYWGDVYSANPADGYCRIPQVLVGTGGTHHEPWLPHVYAAGNIYTLADDDFNFRYFYDDMSPTAHSHPYSEFAQAPDIDFEYFKMQASRNNAYYGPAEIEGGPNPYYINDGEHDIEDFSTSNVKAVVDRLQKLTDVLFVDTTDGLPVSFDTSTGKWNTYTGYLHVTMSASTFRFYEGADKQYFTKGSVFIMGPFSYMGNNPEKGMGCAANCDRISNVPYPDNYYFPRVSNEHYVLQNPVSSSYLKDMKHHGFIYSGGELKIGGPVRICSWKIRLWPPPLVYYSCNDEDPATDIGIYGTIYIGEHGSISAHTSSGKPSLHVYYDRSLNMFGMSGSRILVLSFNRASALTPTYK